MTECLALIPMEKWPNAAYLFAGDPKQFGPISVAADTKRFRDVFGKQRKVSLIDRVYFSGQVDITLIHHYRCHGSAGDWVRDTFYENDMSITYPESIYTLRLREYMRQYSDKEVENSIMWFDVQYSTEYKIGTSYVNPAQARFIVELSVSLLRNAPIPNMKDVSAHESDPSLSIRRGNVMIITGYAHQKALIESLIAKISPGEIIPGSLTVRTIDDSQNHQAAVVLVDIVRTVHPGFIDDRQRLAVALSRAELMHIVVGSEGIIPYRGPLAELFEYARDKGSYSRIGKTKSNWTRWCVQCLSPGHMSHECKAKVICQNCRNENRHDKHAGRYCKFPQPVTGQYLDRLNAVDNVERSIVPDFSRDDSERVPIRRANR